VLKQLPHSGRYIRFPSFHRTDAGAALQRGRGDAAASYQGLHERDTTRITTVVVVVPAELICWELFDAVHAQLS
jgi:hypothetical protein